MPTPETSLQAQLRALTEQHERETVAARALAGDPNPTDAHPLAWVYDVAARYEQCRSQGPEQLNSFLTGLADELTAEDVHALRTAGEAAAAAASRIPQATPVSAATIVRVEHHSDWHAYITCPHRGELGYCLGHGGDEVVDLESGEQAAGEGFDGAVATALLAREGWRVLGPWRDAAPDAEHQYEADAERA